MRISDWSSDVCSSDLVQRQAHRAGRVGAPGEVGGWRLDAARARRATEAAELRLLLLQIARLDPKQLDRVGGGALDRLGNGGGAIGRASSRERGRQDV